MSAYRTGLTVSLMLTLTIGWLWFGERFGIGPATKNTAAILRMHELQEMSIIVLAISCMVSIANCVTYAFTRFRNLSQFNGFLFGLCVITGMFSLFLVASFALALANELKLPAWQGYGIIGACMGLFVLNAASIVAGLRRL